MKTPSPSRSVALLLAGSLACCGGCASQSSSPDASPTEDEVAAFKGGPMPDAVRRKIESARKAKASPTMDKR